MATAIVPQMPQTPWTEMAPTGSSIFTLSKNRMENTTSTPPMAPMMMELITETTSAEAVMLTNPARIPLSAMERSGFLSTAQEMRIEATPPAAAASAVVVKTRPSGPGSAERTEPPLKPNQPKNSRNTPMVASGMLWPRIGLIPSLVYFPWRAPRRITQARAAAPPNPWTTVEPAKSLKGVSRVERKPPPQCHEPAIV